MPANRSVNEIVEDLQQHRKQVTIDNVLYYIVEGDLRLTADELTAYAFELAARENPSAEASAEQRDPLIGATDDAGLIVRWKKGLTLTYAVRKNSFRNEEEYQTVVDAMRVAAADWEAACGVNFAHLSELDSDDASVEEQAGGAKPLFTVKGFDTGGKFIALAFFPNDPPERREIIIDPVYFVADLGYDRYGVLRHELGHVLGFRHEHIRSGAPALCRGESEEHAIQLSDYDPRSVMHYFCGGVGTRDMEITDVDCAAAVKLYGPPDHTVHYYE